MPRRRRQKDQDPLVVLTERRDRAKRAYERAYRSHLWAHQGRSLREKDQMDALEQRKATSLQTLRDAEQALKEYKQAHLEPEDQDDLEDDLEDDLRDYRGLELLGGSR